MNTDNSHIDHISAINGGHPSRHQIFVVAKGTRRQLVPPEGKQFDWGNMGDNATTLARAVAAEIYPEELQDLATFQIKVKFIAPVSKHDNWEVPLEEVRSHVDERIQAQFNRAPA